MRQQTRTVLAVGALLLGAWPARAADDESVASLRQELEAMRAQYEARIDALEARVRQLEGNEVAAPGEAPSVAPGLDLEALRAAAAATLGTAGTQTPEAAPAGSGDRNLNRLNPEISFTGDVIAVGGGRAGEDFSGREFELDMQSALDPYSKTRLTLAFSPDEGVDIEEGWILYNGLPGGVALKAGKFRQRFGALNQQHLHALPQVDYPLVLATFFDDEGLAQTGLALSWLGPHPWASANELILEVTDGESSAFGGGDFDRLVVLGKLKNYWDLGAATYLEWGLSGASGRAGGGFGSEVLGSDLTVHWQPPSRAKYREITWRSEALRSKRDDPSGLAHEAWGGYSYIEGLVRENLYLGLRYDQVEDPLLPELQTSGWFPYLSWWQSEYARSRAQYGLTQGPDGDNDDELTLQITWAAGPHKHETY
jgi:hypothetical protein